MEVKVAVIQSSMITCFISFEWSMQMPPPIATTSLQRVSHKVSDLKHKYIFICLPIPMLFVVLLLLLPSLSFKLSIKLSEWERIFSILRILVYYPGWVNKGIPSFNLFISAQWSWLKIIKLLLPVNNLCIFAWLSTAYLNKRKNKINLITEEEMRRAIIGLLLVCLIGGAVSL